MSGYHENHLVSGTSAVHSLTSPHPLPHQLPHQHQPKPTTSVPPYLSPPNPAAAHSPHVLAHNERTPGSAAAYTASAHDSLTTALQVPITPHGIVNTPSQHQHQQGHQSPPQSQHIRPQTGQYSSPGNHASSASPQSQQAPTPAASTSSAPGKKNTRIPRACDLCSTRKVKVSRFSVLDPQCCSDFFRWQQHLLTLPGTVRRRNASLRALQRPRRPMHIRPCQEAARPSQSSCRGSEAG